MKYIDGFRNPGAAAAMGAEIRGIAAELAGRGVSPNVMEVCGSHTMAIGRYGIRDVLPPNVGLVSGPGCPVCVTDPGYIDAAIELAKQATVVTFGDMINVPGSEMSLARCRAEGGDVHIAYSPAVALNMAEEKPSREVVFLAIGFETTTAPVAALVSEAAAKRLRNFSLLTAFKLVPPALAALLADPEVSVNGFLCPAHVSAIIGSDAYLPFSGPGGVPCVVAGFEPLDILMGIRDLLAQIRDGRADVENEYSRVVTHHGNRKALALMGKHLEPCDASWRGIGTIPNSGLRLRPEFADFDAAGKFGVEVAAGTMRAGCRCGDVLKGKIRPPDCALFGTACTPDNPVGPCMVSSEGTCAAWQKYSGLSMVGEE
jgi:hydrogenase expression/formation protein HypD